MIRWMRALLKFLFFLPIVAIVGGGTAWFWAGRSSGPTVELRQPERFVGQNSTLELVVDAPGGQHSRVDVTLEQGGQSFPVYSLNQPGDAKTSQESATRLNVMGGIGKRAIPELKSGPAKIVVRLSRSSA